MTSNRSPYRDSLLIIKDQKIKFEVQFDAVGPFGAQVLIDGELKGATSLHPAKSSWEVEIPFDKPGTSEVQIMVEGPAKGELDNLENLDPRNIEEVEHVNEKWQVMTIEKDELYETDVEQLKRLITDMLALYSLGKISTTGVRKLREYLDELDNENENDITTLDEFQEIDSQLDSENQ